MTRRNLTLALVVAWAALCAWSVLSYQMTEPSDFGFTRGLNRVSDFLEIQLVAVLIAVVAFALSFRLPGGAAMRWVARAPALLTLVVIAGFALLVAYVVWNDPASTAPENLPPVTEPADR